jgi:hypothetical protein
VLQTHLELIALDLNPYLQRRGEMIGLFYFMNRDFKGVWIPKDIWLDENLTWMEKLLLVEIDSLDAEKGCFASNDYFAKFFQLSKSRISDLIGQLVSKGYITTFLIYEGKQVKRREITMVIPIRKFEGGIRKTEEGYSENAQDNNTLVNNTISNSTNKLYSHKESFVNRVYEFKDKLGNQYESFISYWTEANDKGKMRFQDQKFFDISRRIATWVKNSKNFQPINQETPKIKLK